MSVDLARRSFLQGARNKALPIRPPYSKNETHFVDHCTRCQECVAVCETNIISIGSGNLPQVSFDNDECTFCEKCSDVCPTKALDKLQNKAFTTSIKINEQCFTYSGVCCQSCRDACDVSAIKFDFLSEVIPKPIIDTDACNGCGACVSVCPPDAIKIIQKQESSNE